MGFRKSYVVFTVGHGKCLRWLTRWVGGVEKGQKNAYVIFEWSHSSCPELDETYVSYVSGQEGCYTEPSCKFHIIFH
jgi:hypothetical protein